MKKYRVEVDINVFEVNRDESEEVALTLSSGSRALPMEKMLEALSYILRQQVQATGELLERSEHW